MEAIAEDFHVPGVSDHFSTGDLQLSIAEIKRPDTKMSPPMWPPATFSIRRGNCLNRESRREEMESATFHFPSHRPDPPARFPAWNSDHK